MKLKKNKIIFIALSLLLTVVFAGCAVKTPPADSNIPQTTPEATKSSETQETPEVAEVSGKVEIHEGVYFDDKCFGEYGLKTYYEVVISKVTDTSFDFTVNKVNSQTKDKEVILSANTAIFTGDGTEALSEDDQTLHFTFPDHHSAYPVVTDMEIDGFEPLEGKTFVNNGIPGHEFG